MDGGGKRRRPGYRSVSQSRFSGFIDSADLRAPCCFQGHSALSDAMMLSLPAGRMLTQAHFEPLMAGLRGSGWLLDRVVLPREGYTAEWSHSDLIASKE